MFAVGVGGGGDFIIFRESRLHCDSQCLGAGGLAIFERYMCLAVWLQCGAGKNYSSKTSLETKAMAPNSFVP